MVESRVDEARFPGFAEPDEFHSRPAAAIFGAGVAAKLARPKNARSLVCPAGGEGLFANYDWHGGGSGGFGQRSPQNFEVALSLWLEQIGAQRRHYTKTFSLTRAGFLLKAGCVSGILWIDAAAVRHHAESALSFSHREASRGAQSRSEEHTSEL